MKSLARLRKATIVESRSGLIDILYPRETSCMDSSLNLSDKTTINCIVNKSFLASKIIVLLYWIYLWSQCQYWPWGKIDQFISKIGMITKWCLNYNLTIIRTKIVCMFKLKNYHQTAGCAPNVQAESSRQFNVSNYKVHCCHFCIIIEITWYDQFCCNMEMNNSNLQ